VDQAMDALDRLGEWKLVAAPDLDEEGMFLLLVFAEGRNNADALKQTYELVAQALETCRIEAPLVHLYLTEEDILGEGEDDES
ncbi:MAG: hypothetical protein KDA28_10325, partial [Phycisphaerales bacterium]|nr:hypothetical protein [Phycisphaerales bacterium]